ncbi:MAG: cyclic nucleotide-binding domain-containing protein, partial [Planctomycetota bacterium]
MTDTSSPFSWLHEAAPGLPSRTLAVGEVLVEQGGHLGSLFLIESGSFVIRQSEGLSEPAAIGTRKVGDWVGDVGVIAPGPATATLEAVVETRVSELSHARYAQLRDGGSPAAGRLLSAFCRAFASRLRRSGQQRVGGASTITTLRALHGDDSTPARPSWTPRSATGHSGWMDSRDIVAALDAAGAFRPVDVVDQAYAQALRKDVEMLAPTFGVQSHKDGDPIVKAGDGGDGLFVILEGRVRVTVGDAKGDLAVDRLLGP